MVLHFFFSVEFIPTREWCSHCCYLSIFDTRHIQTIHSIRILFSCVVSCRVVYVHSFVRLKCSPITMTWHSGFWLLSLFLLFILLLFRLRLYTNLILRFRFEFFPQKLCMQMCYEDPIWFEPKMRHNEIKRCQISLSLLKQYNKYIEWDESMETKILHVINGYYMCICFCIGFCACLQYI